MVIKPPRTAFRVLGFLKVHHPAVSLGFLRNYKYGLAFVAGHIIPDAIKFGVPGVIFKTVSYREILSKPLFRVLMNITDNIFTWIILFIFIFGVIFVLYKLKKIDKEKFKKWIIIDFLFFIGIALHLIMDVFIIEKSPWI